MMDTVSAFRQVIERDGLTPPHAIIPDGEIHRFSSNGDRDDDAGWYVLHDDGMPAGMFGCWRSNLKKNWCAKSDTAMTETERAEYRQRLAAIRRQRDADEQRRHVEAAKRAQKIWDQATPAPEDHLYLQKKRIQPHGLRVDDESRLIVPVTIDATITSLQFITPDGDKKFLPGGAVRGGVYAIGDLTESKTILTCEGFATGASLHEATGYPTICALSAGNLLPVAHAIRQQCPSAVIVLAGDNDLRDDATPNTGLEAATAAAKAIGGVLVMPDLDGKKCDWNDVHVQHGLDAVTQALNKEQPMMSADPHYIPSAGPAHLHTPPTLAQEPHILAVFERAVQACGVVGEARCAQLLYLALTSRVLAEPVSLAIKGLSSSGKSFTTETTLKFFPLAAYLSMTAMSERALVYMKEEFSHKTLVIFEAVALREQREKNDSNLTAYFVRSLLSEGRIAYPVTVHDKAGGFITKTIVKEGPTNLILTTTATELHGENETRLLSIPTNDTSDQTKAVMRRLAAGRADAVNLQDWHDLQDWLATAEHRVVIPYASYLAEQIPPVAVRLRRDFKALLRLIDAHAILHQHTRARDADGCIVAHPEDYYAVRELVADLLSAGVGATVSETMRATVHAVKEADRGEGVTVRHVSDVLTLDRSATQRRAKAARERGYLVNLEEKRGRPARYAIGDPLPEEIDLLPRTIPGGGVQHTSLDACTPSHGLNGSESTPSAGGVQLCTDSGERYTDESEEVIDLVD